MPANHTAENAPAEIANSCAECQRSFKSRRALTQHNRVVHEGKGAFGKSRAREEPEPEKEPNSQPAAANPPPSPRVSPLYGLPTDPSMSLACPHCLAKDVRENADAASDVQMVDLFHGPTEGAFMGNCERCGLILALPFPSPAGQETWNRAFHPYPEAEEKEEPEPEIPRYETGTILRFGNADYSVTRKGGLEHELLPPRRGIEVTGRFYANDTLYEIAKGKARRVEEDRPITDGKPTEKKAPGFRVLW